VSSWAAIIVEGAEGKLRAFVAGFLAGRQLPSTSVAFGCDLRLEHASLTERLRALLTGGHHLLLAPPELAPALREAIARGGPDVGLHAAGQHDISEAWFDIDATVYARDVAQTIRGVLAAVPHGARLEAYEEHEEVQPEYKAIELYTPVHDYRYRIHVRVIGAVGGVLAIRRELDRIEAVQLSPLHLRDGPLPTSASQEPGAPRKL